MKRIRRRRNSCCLSVTLLLAGSHVSWSSSSSPTASPSYPVMNNTEWEYSDSNNTASDTASLGHGNATSSTDFLDNQEQADSNMTRTNSTLAESLRTIPTRDNIFHRQDERPMAEIPDHLLNHTSIIDINTNTTNQQNDDTLRRGIFNRDENRRPPAHIPSQLKQQQHYRGSSKSFKKKQYSKSKSSSNDKPAHLGGIFLARPASSGVKGKGSSYSNNNNKGRRMQVDLANFSVRLRGNQVNANELLTTLEGYLLTEMRRDIRTLSAIALTRVSFYFGGTALVGLVTQERVIAQQTKALSNCRRLQAAVDRNWKISSGRAIVTAIFVDSHSAPIFCDANIPPPTITTQPPPPVPQPTRAPILLPPISLPTRAPTPPTSVPSPPLPATQRPSGPPVPTAMPSAAPFEVTSDFDRACSEGASFLYLPSEVSNVECTCSRPETNILCTRPDSRSASCLSVTTNLCLESYERWQFSQFDGSLQAIELCRDCLGSECNPQGIPRDECMRLNYQSDDVVGCSILRTYQVPPNNPLPTCGTCSLCESPQFNDPGIVHTCPGYTGRPDQGFLLNENVCHSISLDVLFNVGFRYPRTYGQVPPPVDDTPTVAPGCCAGNVLPCEFFTTETGCLSQIGCSFGFGVCFGEAQMCGVFNGSSEELCERQDGCRWTC